MAELRLEHLQFDLDYEVSVVLDRKQVTEFIIVTTSTWYFLSFLNCFFSSLKIPVY